MLAGLSEWLDAYGAAWESRDPEAATELFSEDAVYQWGPFAQRLRGPVMIREAWAEALETAPQSAEFGYEILAATNRGGIVRWWRKSNGEQLEGIFRLAFDETGQCKSLQVWWNSDDETREPPK